MRATKGFGISSKVQKNLDRDFKFLSKLLSNSEIIKANDFLQAYYKKNGGNATKILTKKIYAKHEKGYEEVYRFAEMKAMMEYIDSFPSNDEEDPDWEEDEEEY